MKIGDNTRMVLSACTACGKLCDGATGVGCDGGPGPGDWTICFYCGHLMAFADDLTLRNLSDAEMVEVAGDPRIIAVQRARAHE
jgi:hypothetical protein